MKKIMHISNDFCLTKVHSMLYQELDGLGVEQTVFNPVRDSDYVGRNRFEGQHTTIIYAHVVKSWHKYAYHLKRRHVFSEMLKRINPTEYSLTHATTLLTDGGLYIRPNTVGAGFCPLHPGFVRIGHYVHIGKNCTVLPMVLIGKRRSGPCTITIGDDCYVGTGVTILGPLTIGNNVTIGAGAVVTTDVPDNVVVAGVPAKVVKIKD